MTNIELELLLRQLLGDGVQLHPTSYLALVLVSLLTAGIGAYVGAYLRKRAENLATKEDFDTLLAQLSRQTTEVEAIKAEMARAGWVHQRRWELSRDIYYELLRTLEELRQKGRWLSHAVGRTPAPDGAREYHMDLNIYGRSRDYEYVKIFADHMIERGTVEKLLASKAVSGIVLSETVVSSLDNLSDLYNFGLEEILRDPDPRHLTDFLRNNLDGLLRATDDTYRIVLEASQVNLLEPNTGRENR